MVRSAGLRAGCAILLVLVASMCFLPEPACCQESVVLDDYTPKSGPVSGGTQINVTGTGFITTGMYRSKCRFELSGRANVLSDENLNVNETFLTCCLPEIKFLTDSQLQNGNRMTRLSITGSMGTFSNYAEFFLYDLDRIRVYSISPVEGLVNSTNITLSIQGVNFLDTDEITCSVEGSHKVPAWYINSTSLQCVLAPFPQTTIVTIDISMNGQAVANIAPLTSNSTIFTYLASPPVVQSCHFTPSYAQLLLIFDREIEIGDEERPDMFIPSTLSCNDVFSENTLQNTIGLDSTCLWHNTAQRQIVVQLSSNSQVQLGSLLRIKNNTIRTRYVKYSRLGSGDVAVSLPEIDSEQFLPEAIIEAPSIIPYCGNFTISGAKSQYGGSGGLKYRWIVGTDYDENGTLIQDSVLADYVPNGFTSQSVLELSSDIFNPDLLGSGSGSTPITIASSFDIQLLVRNFLGFTSTAQIRNLTRAESVQPSVVIVGGNEKKIRTSDDTILEGRIIFPSECPMVEEITMVTYSWRVVNQHNQAVSLLDLPQSSVLVIPPYLLEVGSEYTATLSVGFGMSFSAVEASVRLVTNAEMVARIRNGVRRSFGANEVILLDGRSSEYVNTSSAVLEITWGCVGIDSGENCVDRNGQALLFSSDSFVQSIPSGTLQPGEYNFTLRLNLVGEFEVLETIAYQTVVILAYMIPRVEITSDSGTDLESILVHKEMILDVRVQSDIPGVAQWTSEYVIGYAQVDLNDNRTVRSPLIYNITDISADSHSHMYTERATDLFTSSRYSTSNSFANQVTLIITANSLLPQNTYRLKFTAVDKMGNSGFAEVDIHTESVPTSGELTISPQTGSPFTTSILISARGWTDDLGDTPLLYQFGLRYIFFNSTEISNTQLPLCCNLMYDNFLFTNNQLENVSCICEFLSTGVSEQNELLTTLPLQSGVSSITGVSVQVQQLVRIFDRNGAVTEASQMLNDFATEQASEESDDPSQLLQPLSDSQREDFDILALLDKTRQLSHINWRRALAQLTTLVSSAEVNNFIKSSRFNITSPVMSQFKLKATELALDIYDSYIPISKSYLNVIVGILYSTTSSPGITLTSNEMLISRILNFVRVLVDLYNNFDADSIFSPPELSTSESQMLIQILHNLVNTGQRKNIFRIRENLVTQTFLSLVPKLGLGLCSSERYSFVNGAVGPLLKASITNLPMDYQSTEQCRLRQMSNTKRAKFCLNKNVPEVTVNFSRALFERYLWWPCGAETEGDDGVGSNCSGVCLTSAQHTQDLLWQGSPYASQLKSLVFQLYLLNPRNGSILEISHTATESQARMTRNMKTALDQMDIRFPILANYSNASNLQCAYWNGTSARRWISKSEFSGETLASNGMVIEKICHFRASLGSIFTILERCPDGHYGRECLDVCPEGLWGSECQESCDCNSRGDCSPVDGSCDCDPGWLGDNCQTRCPVGMWGKYCVEACLCENGAECDHVTGFCTCTPGWIGTFCNVSCPDGFYGSSCREECVCNQIEECDKITGSCTCNSGFTGPTCHDICPSGFYGDGCASECQCFMVGTLSCHNINGTCNCFDDWMGELCNVEITPPPEPTFQIWWVVIGLVVVVVLSVVAVSVVFIIIIFKRKKKRKKVLPITDDETGDQVSYHKDASDDVASGFDVNIGVTRTHSVEVVVPPGKELKDIFISPTAKIPDDDEEEESEFREPSELGGKLRWEIIRLMPSKSKSSTRDVEHDKSYDSEKKGKTEVVDDPVQLDENIEEMPDSSLEVSKITQESSRSKYSEDGRNESEDDQMSEIVYKQGVYLSPDATLKDLRNGFIEQEKLEAHERYFQLLKSDVPGDIIEIDTEEEVLLSQIEQTLIQQRTVYIENVDPATVTMELCVCGKFADLECSECGGRGYCSVECQQNDWFKHVMVCREKSEERRRREESARSKKKKKKKKHKKHKKHRKSKSRESKRSRDYTPSIDICICGKEAEFECSGCDKQGYCSEECQRNDWDIHQMFCIPSVTVTPADNVEEGSDDDSSRREPTPTVLTPLKRTSLETLMEETEESETESKTAI